MTNASDRSTVAVASRLPDATWVSRFIERFIGAPLAWHVVGGVVILVLGLGLIHPSETWTSDEGAVRFQVELLSTDGSWSAMRPFAELDPEEITSPIHASTIVGDRYAPYTKQPLLPTLLVPVRRLLGEGALVLPALLGTVVAAIMGALIAGVLHRRIRNLTFWVLAFGTPLLFYGYTVLAHTVAAALAGVALFVVFRRSDRPVVVGLIATVVVFLAVLLRTEAAAFGVALAVAVAFDQGRGDRATRGLLSGSIVIGTFAAVVVNRMWAISVGGVAPVSEGEGILVWFRFVSGVFSSTVLTDFGPPQLLSVVLAMSGGISLLVVVVRREPGNVRLQRILAGVSIAGTLALVLVIPEPIGGVLAATPVLLAGLVSIRREHVADPRMRFILIVIVVFVAAVFATQERGGGGAQWGGRYLMLVLPAAVPMALLALRSLLAKSSFARPLVVSVLVLMTLSLSTNALLVLRSGRENSVVRAADLTELADRLDAVGVHPTLVSSNTHLGRHAWRTIDDTDYFLVPSDEFTEYVRRLADTGIEEFGVVGGWSADRAAFFSSLGYEPVDIEAAPFMVVRRVER